MIDRQNLLEREQQLLNYYKSAAKDGDKNAQMILKYHEYLILFESQYVSKSRSNTILANLKLITKYFDKPIHDCSLRDIVKGVNSLENDTKNGKFYSPHTIKTRKVALKKYLSWIEYGDETITKLKTIGRPDRSKAIITTFSKQDKFKVMMNENEVLTRKEVLDLIDNAESVRDKALLAFLYETGCRPAELRGLQFKHVKFTSIKGEIKVNLYGKTGHRVNLIKYYSKFIIPYFNSLNNTKPDDYVFVTKHGKPMTNHTLLMMMRRLGKRVGITKRLYPYLFRHTSITHKISGKFDGRQYAPQILKKLIGHTQASNQLNTYSHLSEDDALEYIRGITSKVEKEPMFISCSNPSCNAVNQYENAICYICSSQLGESKHQEMLQQDAVDQLKDKLTKMMAAFVQQKYGQGSEIQNTWEGNSEDLLKVLGIGK